MKHKKVLSFLLAALALPSCNIFNHEETINLNRLTTPRVKKIETKNNNSMSLRTYESYTAFSRKFSSLMMEISRQEKEESVGISIPDAYLCLAITGAISTDEARSDVLSYLELANMSELRTATKEIVSTLATLYKNSDGKLVGGYNLNSVWFNPSKVELLKEKDEQLYKDLEEVFDASLYMEPLTSDRANQYLKNEGLKDMPTPEIKLSDDDPDAMNVMSVYYCLDYFNAELKAMYKNEYKNGSHKMEYTYGGKTSKVDYIGSVKLTDVYESSNFYGSSLPINYLDMAFFLPNDKNALPSSILDDVLNEKYSLKKSTFIDYDEVKKETTTHKVTINAPYFSLDNETELSGEYLTSILPIITSHGAGERIARALDGYLYLDYIKQFSVMKFNYDGFYSCSVTISGIKNESAFMTPEYEKFLLNLNHPYVFEVRKNIRINGDFVKIPLVIGEIVTPEYKD